MAQAQQQEIIATVNGKAWLEKPQQLFIPPDAMEVLLEQFSGPLDLLLYLIRKQNFDISQVSISHVTEQYIQYLDWLQAKKLNLAAEYLVMAALLALIKSKRLLPQAIQNEEVEEDPQINLLQRLVIYEHFKLCAQALQHAPQAYRDFYPIQIFNRPLHQIEADPKLSVEMLEKAFKKLNSHRECYESHQVYLEPLKISDKIQSIVAQLKSKKLTDIKTLYEINEGRPGIIVTFLAILELAKQARILLSQHSSNDTLFICSVDEN